MTSFSKNTLTPWQPTNSQGSFLQLLRCLGVCIPNLRRRNISRRRKKKRRRSWEEKDVNRNNKKNKVGGIGRNRLHCVYTIKRTGKVTNILGVLTDLYFHFPTLITGKWTPAAVVILKSLNLWGKFWSLWEKIQF